MTALFQHKRERTHTFASVFVRLCWSIFSIVSFASAWGCASGAVSNAVDGGGGTDTQPGTDSDADGDSDGDVDSDSDSDSDADGDTDADADADADTDSDADTDTDADAAPVFSEIMYHAVLDDGFEESYEFVEIHNPGEAALSLDGWKIEGGISFAFASGTSLGAGGYLVIAKNRDALLSEYAGEVDPSRVVGNYTGELDNGGEELRLKSPDGDPVDAFEYDDELPWPIGADALGAGAKWLSAALGSPETHKHRGYSLERVSFTSDADAPANWVTSELDAPTLGKESPSLRDVPLPVVESIAATPANTANAFILATDTVRIEARFSAEGAVENPRIEGFADNLAAEGEALTVFSLVDDGTGVDKTAGDDIFTASVSPLAANSIVRYRVVGDRGLGDEVISPRPTDPYSFHSYFVTPPVSSANRVFQLFIAPSRWTEMWDNLKDGPLNGCEISPTWDAQVPAVFVHQGHVYDVRVRYQGSRYLRNYGIDFPSWPYPGPLRPSPVKGLSWRVAFPRYDDFEKQDVLNLNRMVKAPWSAMCPGLAASVGFALFREAGILAPSTEFVRLEINGGYYRTMQKIDHPDENMLEALHEAEHEENPALPLEPVGHLFKSEGRTWDEGPYGFGNESVLEEFCGYTVAERYAATYERASHDWADYAPVQALIEGLATARASGSTALKAYLDATFDVPEVLTYLAVNNWIVHADDYTHNHFLYQRLSDGLWTVIPWDLEGAFEYPTVSFFFGEEGDPNNSCDSTTCWWNVLKDSFFEVYRDEYIARLDELALTVLSPEHVTAVIDEAVADFDVTEADAAPGGLGCGNFADTVSAYKAFAVARDAALDAL